jgi:ubiquinone/menaquinone biosynthesis C-methylase UbiE
MDRFQFDRVADEYRTLHARNIRHTGETPEFFAEYKIKDVATALADEVGERLRILDFGTGVGNSLPYFRKYFPQSVIIGADVSSRCLALAAQRFPGIASLVVFDGERLPFHDQSFDAVLAANVFHHIEPQEHPKHLSDLCRVLRPGGRLFLFEHNPFNPLTVHAVHTCEFDQDAQLVRPRVLRGCLKAAGFSVVKVRFRIFFPHFLRGLRPLEEWMTFLPLGAQYCATATRPAQRLA